METSCEDDDNHYQRTTARMTKTKTVFLVCISAIILILLDIELSAVCMISPFQIQHLNVFTKQNDNQCNIFFAWMKLKKNYWGFEVK